MAQDSEQATPERLEGGAAAKSGGATEGMKLIGADASPFVQRVKIAARLKGIHLEAAPIPEGGLKGEIVRGLNPMARMPVLIFEDGWALAESAAIAAFLDESVDGYPLFPADPRDRAMVRWMVQLVDGPLDAGLRNIVRSRVVPGSSSPVDAWDVSAIAELGLSELHEGLAAIARLAGEGGRLVTEQATLADAALVPILEMLEVIRPWNKVGDQIIIPPSLLAYWDKMRSQPVFERAGLELRESFQHIAKLWGLIPAR